MMCNGNRVVARRMNLRADHPLLVTAILPHEVTHVVLADLFTTQQIPRWADEGLAVLAEPTTEQETRAAELRGPLEAGRIFDLRKLMAMDYPNANDWSLYYAQSVSLTRFLVERGPPEQFLQFVQNSQRDGIEGIARHLRVRQLRRTARTMDGLRSPTIDRHQGSQSRLGFSTRRDRAQMTKCSISHEASAS